MYFMGYDPLYYLVFVGLLISFFVSLSLKSTYAKYEKVLASKNITTKEVCEIILHSADIYDVQIDRISGSLTDHYSPKEKVIRLSDSTANSSSIAAIGVCAHECGHAIQDKIAFAPLVLSMKVTPVVAFCSQISIPIILVSFLLGITGLIKIGVILFSVTLFYQILTLPIEFDASRRAVKVLRETEILDEEELYGVKKVLGAAAMTYVAAAVTTALQLLRFLAMAKRRR